MGTTTAVRIVAGLELLAGVVAKRLEHPVASRSVGTGLDAQHRLRDQAR
jgi:hypothetical protein